MQSVLTWLSLPQDGVLLLETFEDFDVVRPNSISTTQVKDTSSDRKLTLLDQGFKKSLVGFWRLANANPKIKITLCFLSRAAIGHERDYSFPDEVSGIEYWGLCKSGSALKPLRDSLGKIFEDEPLGTWLKSDIEDDVVLSTLIEPVTWCVSAPDSDEVRVLLTEQTVGHCIANGYSASESHTAASSLIDEVLDRASQPIPEARQLTREDIALCLHRALRPSRLGSEGGAFLTFPPGLSINTVPQNLVPRDSLSNTYKTTLMKRGILYLHGASGVGKSALASLTAEALGGEWILADMREVATSDAASLSRLRTLYPASRAPVRAQGVIIDDLPDVLLGSQAATLKRFISWARSSKLYLILTAYREPSPAARSALGLPDDTVCEAPYLELVDIAELLSRSGAPDSKKDAIAALVYATTGGGHPQLVAAKITALASDDWSIDPLVSEIAGKPMKEVRLTQDEARRRLLTDINSKDALKLLKRLSVIVGGFDQTDALSVSKVSPLIPDTGDHLAYLIGPWIETTPYGDFRISPLLGQLSNDLPTDEKKSVAGTAAETILSRRLLNYRTLPRCFWNAFAAEREDLLGLLVSILSSKTEDEWVKIAPMLEAVSVFHTDRLIYPKNKHLSACLRILQIDVALGLGKADLALKIVRRFFVEIADLPRDLAVDGLKFMARTKILFARGVKLPWRERIEWLGSYEAELSSFGEDESGKLIESAKVALSELGAKGSVIEFFAAVGAETVKTIKDFSEFFEIMGEIEPAFRARLLSGISSVRGGHAPTVQEPWANDYFDDVLDVDEAMQVYVRAAELAESWNEADLAGECIIAQSVLADELQKDTERALDLVEAGITKFGTTTPLIRQKYKVLKNNRRYDEAYKTFLTVSSTVGPHSSVDRAYALRDGAIAAAFVGKHSDATKWFIEAAAAANASEGLAIFETLLTLEAAASAFRAGEFMNSCEFASKALSSLDRLDGNANRANEFVYRMVYYVIGWLNQSATNGECNATLLEPGAASNSDRDLGLSIEKPIGRIEDIWALLRAYEIRTDAGDEVRKAFEAREDQRRRVEIQFDLDSAEFCLQARKGNAAQAFESGIRALSGIRNLKKLRESAGDNDVMSMPRDLSDLRKFSLDEITDVDFTPASRGMIVAFLITATLSGKMTSVQLNEAAVSAKTAFQDKLPVDDLFVAFERAKPIGAGASDICVHAAAAAGRVYKGGMTASEAIEVHLILCQFATQGDLLADTYRWLLVQSVADYWLNVAKHGRFALTNPAVSAPLLLEAASSVNMAGYQSLGAILTAAAAALGQRLSPDWANVFRKYARA